MPTIPIKDYIYLGIILALATAFGWYTFHERSIGSAAVVASDRKADQAQRERDTALQTATALATSITNGDYNHEIAAPIVDAPVPVGLCNASDPITLPAASSSDSSGKVAAVSGAENASAAAQLQRLTEFADAAVEIARDADAQVEALEKINADLRSEMENSNGPSK